MSPLRVYPTYLQVAPESLRGGVAVVIDLIRASTTIIHALGNGAAAVIPCEQIEEAIARKAERPDLLLGGERRGVRIEGFDLGNSPAEYTPERVRGRVIAFTTTNGTRALHRSALADLVLVGAFANIHALLATLRREARPIHLICAGVDGEACLEDTLCAGAIAAGWRRTTGQTIRDPDASAAISEWEQVSASLTTFTAALARSEGGRNLAAAGLERDLPDVARWDIHTVVPRLDTSTDSLIPSPDRGPPPPQILVPPS